MSLRPEKRVRLIVLAFLLGACATFPKTSREDQWSYFEEWDSNRDISIDFPEFARGYIEQDYFETWAGKKNEVSNDVLVAELLKGSEELKKSIAASGDWDTEASARRRSNEMRPPNMLEELREFVNKADSNNNERTNRDEWARAMFQLADDNLDGNLSPIEFYLWQLLRG